MTDSKKSERRFTQDVRLETAATLLEQMVPVDHPVHGVLATVRLLVQRANENPDCSECVALVGFAACALRTANMNDLEQLADLSAVTYAALSDFNHHRSSND